MAKYRKSRSTRRKRTVAKRRRGVRARRTRTKKQIRRVVSAMAETKRSQFYQLSRDLYASNTPASTFNAQNIFSLTPGGGVFEIVQGTTVSSRVGNKIRCKRNSWNFVFHPKPYNATSNISPCPMLVNVVLFYERESPTLLPTNIQNDFFQYGALNQALTADITDNYAPFNTEKYRILKVYKKKVGTSSSNGTGGAAAYQYFQNNDFSYNWNLKINVAKYAPKMITYLNNAISPKTRNVYCAVYYSRADGIIDTPGQSSLNVQMVGDFRYSDN